MTLHRNTAFIGAAACLLLLLLTSMLLQRHGGFLATCAALAAFSGAALLWANSPYSAAYHRVSETVIGPRALHLDLSVSAWVADGLLAIFFFVVGLELKREFVAGDLRDPARAALPILAAVGGMVVPAAVYIAVNLAAGSPDTLDGWAVPTATDIAFALAVLAVISTHLPAALRTFLLTLAVVDDLLAITVIAVFYTDHLAPLPLFGAMALTKRTCAPAEPVALVNAAIEKGIHPGRPHEMELEMERLWPRSWIYVAHESQLAQPGAHGSDTERRALGRLPGAAAQDAARPDQLQRHGAGQRRGRGDGDHRGRRHHHQQQAQQEQRPQGVGRRRHPRASSWA
mgnify:CR=1 FL=1